MFGREFWREVQQYFQRQSAGSNLQHLEQSITGLLLVLREFVNALSVPQKLWRTVEAEILDPSVGLDQRVGDGAFTKRWWLVQQFGFNVLYAALQSLTLAELASLAVTDANSNIVTDANGVPVRPFASMDPALLGEYAQFTIDNLAWSESPTPENEA